MFHGFSRVENSYSSTIMVVVMVFTLFGVEEGTDSALDADLRAFTAFLLVMSSFGQRLRRHGEFFAL